MKIEGRIMFRPACILLSLILVWPASSVLADEKVSAILEGIRKQYGKLPGLSIPYKREIITRSMAMLGASTEGDLATGKIHFKPPQFLKVEQETPKHEIMTTDGTTLWWYIPYKGQIYRYPPHKLGRELRLLSDIFHGFRAAEENFDVILIGRNDKGEHQLKLTPNPPWPEIHHINLSISQEDYTIRAVEIQNYLKGITRFILGDFSVRGDFQEDFFRLVVPEGVKVIEKK